MKKNRLVVIVCLAALLCACQPDNTSDVAESLVWETVPQLTWGTLEYEKLEAEPWYSGRCEATSQNGMAETGLGFYYATTTNLFYADKADLSNWVPVCGKPNCSHNNKGCNSDLLINEFVIRDGRIYFQDWSGKYQTKTNGFGISLYSKTLSGTDAALAYAVGESNDTGGGSAGMTLSSYRWLVSTQMMNLDGSYTIQLFSVDGDGEKLLYELHSEEERAGDAARSDVYGDAYYNCYSLFPGQPFRIEGEELVLLDAYAVPDNGGYISGNTLRVFRPNDGYYDIDITTGEEVKLAGAQLENSDARICLPNCIIETTLLQSGVEQRTEGMQHGMRFFDGEVWHTVELPEELALPSAYLKVAAVASDCIVFSCHTLQRPAEDPGMPLYRIDLNGDRTALEYCGTVPMS